MEILDLKGYVIRHVDAEEYYKSIFPSWDKRNRENQRCIAHDDKGRPNMAIALDNGGAKCWKCGQAWGNIVHFESVRSNTSEKDAALSLYSKFVHRIYPVTEIDKAIKRLSQMEKFQQYIEKDCGLTAESQERFQLGVDGKTYRITIPIRDRFNNFTNVRMYQLPRHRTATTQSKCYNASIEKDGEKHGYGYLELFPWQEIRKFTPRKPVFHMKAEKDTMLALQMGLQAFCVTNGERAWDDEWNNLFEDYHVGICLDPDETGRAAAENKFAILQNHARSVTDIVLPFARRSTNLKDFADWILKEGHGKVDFLSVYERASKPKINGHVKTPPSDSIKLPDYYSKEYHPLIEIGRNADMMNAIVKVKGIVSAKTDKTYTIPYKFILSSTSSPRREWQIPIGRELLRLVRTSDDKIIDFIKQDLLKAPKVKLEPTEYITVTEVEVIPVVSPEQDAPYVTQRCYFFGKHIEANVPYELEIIPTTDIRTQETVGIIVKTRPIALSIEEFVFEKKKLEPLEQFQPDGTVMEQLYNIANEISTQYTRIYNRLDWHIVALLSWCCPLQFTFPNEGIQRGWLNTLVLGDTQTGKSQVTNALQRIFNCGTIINAENCTYVGLVGGAVKMGSGQFMLRWGRIPLANKQLVVIEELSGLSITDISNMSEVRSSGVARLDKGGLSSETSARTRLVCLSNVRGRDKNLAGSLSGVRAVQELVGHGEDIARFDLIITLTDTEVSSSVINQELYDQETFHSLREEDLRLLVQFIWALKADQIEIPKETYQACLRNTKEMGERYHSSIPLFKAGSGRIKLARVACAIACLQFAWDWKKQKIIVTPEHVEAAVAILQMLYDKPSLGYLTYSQQMIYRSQVRSQAELDAEFQSVITNLNRRVDVLSYMIHAAKFTRDELCQVASIQMIQADRIIARMIGSNIIRKGEANVWEVTPLGKTWMETSLDGLTPKQKQSSNGHSLRSPGLRVGSKISGSLKLKKHSWRRS